MVKNEKGHYLRRTEMEYWIKLSGTEGVSFISKGWTEKIILIRIRFLKFLFKSVVLVDVDDL